VFAGYRPTAKVVELSLCVFRTPLQSDQDLPFEKKKKLMPKLIRGLKLVRVEK
jgi:hypothetical protein